MIRRGARALAVLIAGAVLTPAAAQDLACVREQKPMIEAELLFGRNIGGRHGVTEARWDRFVAAEIAPRFPNGFTVLDGKGQWRDPQRGRPVRERSKLVILVTADDEAARDHISAIASAYKRRFRQQSVAVLTRRVCASF